LRTILPAGREGHKQRRRRNRDFEFAIAFINSDILRRHVNCGQLSSGFDEPVFLGQTMFNHTIGIQALVLLLLALATNCPAAEPKATADKPIAPRLATIQSPNGTVKFAFDSLARQTGLEVDFSAVDARKQYKMAFDKAEFWKIVDGVADLSGSRVEIGKQVRLIPNTSRTKPIVSVDGPFRIAVTNIDVQSKLVEGISSYDMTLEIAWESRLPVVRMDAVPTIQTGHDDAQRLITVKPYKSRNMVDGSVASQKVRLEGITRESKQIAVLAGSYRVTAAEETLRFSFDDLGKFPVARNHGGVSVNIKSFAKVGTFWIADIDLSYPPDGPVFESFENSWLSRNRLTLVSPDGKKHTTTEGEINGFSIRYRFNETDDFKPGNLKGWKLEYETTGAMREVTVKFELKGIPLP
jgi:hypothetical protein